MSHNSGKINEKKPEPGNNKSFKPDIIKTYGHLQH